MPRFKSAALAATMPLVFAPIAVGQQGVFTEPVPAQGGFVGGGFGTAFPETGETTVESQGVGVLISPDGSKVWGFALASGGLAPLPVDVPEEERGTLQPVVSGGILMLVVDGVAYAYGGESGEWGSQEIGDRENAVPIVGSDVAAIRVAGGVYAFSGVTGTGGLHPLGDGEVTGGPVVGAQYVKVASDRGFGYFSARAGKWGSVKYPEPPAGEDAGDEDGTDEGDDAGAPAPAEQVEEIMEEAGEAIEEIGEAVEEAMEEAAEQAAEAPADSPADTPAPAEPAPAPPEGK